MCWAVATVKSQGSPCGAHSLCTEFLWFRFLKNVPKFTINWWYKPFPNGWFMTLFYPLYKHDIWYTYSQYVCVYVCVVQPRDMLPMNMFIPSLHVMNLNVNEWLLLFPGWKGLNHKIMNSVFNRLRSKCLPTEHHKLFSFVPSLLHRYQFVQTEVQISIRSVQTGVFFGHVQESIGPPWAFTPKERLPMVFPHEILEVHLLRNQLCLSLIARCGAWRLPLPQHHGGRAVAQW